MFVPGKPSQPSLMFVGKARGLPRVEDLKGASLGWAPARLGWKGLHGTNTLAYFENPQITAGKVFIVQAPGGPVLLNQLRP